MTYETKVNKSGAMPRRKVLLIFLKIPLKEQRTKSQEPSNACSASGIIRTEAGTIHQTRLGSWLFR